MTPRISVVVTTYEWPAALALVLEALRTQRRAPHEVLVADDGSGAATRRVVEAARARSTVPLRHVWAPDEGFTLNANRNRALVAATGDYVILLDGDMVAHPALVADHAAAMRPGQYVQGSRVLLGPAPTARALAAGRVDVRWWHRDLRNRVNALRLPPLARALDRPVAAIHRTRGAHLAFWRDDALAINGFDEWFRSFGRDDSDFVARLQHAGVVRRNLKFAAVAWHLHHGAGGTVAAANEARLLATLAERRTWTPEGADRHVGRLLEWEARHAAGDAPRADDVAATHPGR
jgi:glycosyltransferase involved in cell wall biosynthesis